MHANKMHYWFFGCRLGPFFFFFGCPEASSVILLRARSVALLWDLNKNLVVRTEKHYILGPHAQWMLITEEATSNRKSCISAFKFVHGNMLIWNNDCRGKIRWMLLSGQNYCFKTTALKEIHLKSLESNFMENKLGRLFFKGKE